MHIATECIGIGNIRCRNHERPVLGPDDKVRSHSAFGAELCQISSVDIFNNIWRGTEVENKRIVVSAAWRAFLNACTANNRSDMLDRHQRSGKFRLRKHLPTGPVDVILHCADSRDHSIVGIFCTLAERHQTVFEQHQAFYVSMVGIDPLGRACKLDTGPDIGHNTHTIAKHLPAERFTIRLIAQGEQCLCMSMENIAMGKKCMQEGLDRRRQPLLHHIVVQAEQVQKKKVLELLVGEATKILFAMAPPLVDQLEQSLHRLKPDRSKIVRNNLFEINTAAFDKQDIGLVAQDVGKLAFDRCITAAMHDQPVFAAEKT